MCCFCNWWAIGIIWQHPSGPAKEKTAGTVRKNISAAPGCRDVSVYPKSPAEFAAKAANQVEIVFGRGVYVDENTAQAASVEFVRQRRINYARSRLQNLAEKAEGLFRQIKTAAERLLFFADIIFYGYKGFWMGMVDQSSITSWDISSMLWG